jgi:hypothetical protein
MWLVMANSQNVSTHQSPRPRLHKEIFDKQRCCVQAKRLLIATLGLEIVRRVG